VGSKSLANQILAKARKNPSTFGALAAQYSQDTQTADSGGEIGLVGRSQVVSLLGKAKTKVGTVQLVHTQGEYIVLHIIRRQVTPLSEASAQLKAAMYAGQATALLQKAIADEAHRVGVHVSPRYGRWDATTQTVLAVKSPISVPN
jgi:peptidyl-prolyl cis-trans isomerase D